MTKKEPIHTPHDALFKDAMSDPKVYLELFQAFIPENVLKLTDLEKIKPTKDHFVTNELRKYYSDCLYTAPIDGKEGYFYILIEHQSQPDPLMAFRMWQYMMMIWDRHVRKMKDKKLPFIYPLILYSGNRHYRYTTDIKDLIQGPRHLVETLFQEPIPLVSLRDTPDEDLKKHIHLAIYMLSLKHAFDDVMPIEEILKLVAEVYNKMEFKDHFHVLCHYWLEVSENLDIDRMLKWAHTSSNRELEDIIMTAAEKLRAEGREEGREEEKTKVALNFLELGSDPRLVASATGLSFQKIKLLQKQLDKD